jgi:hypothetical protein
LVLLTHFSTPPQDFGEPDAYLVPATVCKWRALFGCGHAPQQAEDSTP